jgi:hypothetical protein
MIDYATILTANYANSEWTLDGNTYEGLTWLSETTKPTQAELDAQWASVQTKLAKAITDKATAKQAVLDRLGITAEEAALLLG